MVTCAWLTCKRDVTLDVSNYCPLCMYAPPVAVPAGSINTSINSYLLGHYSLTMTSIDH